MLSQKEEPNLFHSWSMTDESLVMQVSISWQMQLESHLDQEVSMLSTFHLLTSLLSLDHARESLCITIYRFCCAKGVVTGNEYDETILSYRVILLTAYGSGHARIIMHTCSGLLLF